MQNYKKLWFFLIFTLYLQRYYILKEHNYES